MKFKLPEDLSALSIEKLDELYAEALAESQELAALPDADITDAQLDDLETIGGHLDAIEARKTELVEAEAERTARLAAARGKVADASTPADEPDEDATEDGDDEGGEDDDEPVEIPDDASELVEAEEKELVTASANTPRRTNVVRKGAGKSTPDLPQKPRGSVLTAAAKLPGVDIKEAFTDFGHLASTWREHEAKSPTSNVRNDISDIRPVMKLTKGHVRQGFAKIHKPDLTFATGLDQSVEEQLRIIDEAADERKRFGSEGLAKRALTAAGGWCAPSETVYDFCSFETVSGILDIPTVQIRRGGINFTKGPDYATLAANWGFMQTETEAEAGTLKECYEVECPPFADHRMDVVGFCVTAGVLTASPAGYPELIRRVLEIGSVAHAHKVNADTISRISTLIGPAVDHAEIGATTNDVLDALALQAARLRYQLALAPNATVEGVAPLWLKDVLKADLGRRTGIDLLSVGDADLNRYLANRGVRLQFVYDYQPLAGTNTGTWTSFPDTVEIMLWPAGAFVRGTSNVIDLDTIYDSVGLSTNSYTAAFFEEGQMVFNRCGFGVKVSIDVSCLAGRSGAADVECVVIP